MLSMKNSQEHSERCGQNGGKLQPTQIAPSPSPGSGAVRG